MYSTMFRFNEIMDMLSIFDWIGIGIPIMHPDVLNADKWAQNGNHLGQLLMEIRLLLNY